MEPSVLQFLRSFGPFCLGVTIVFKQRRFDERLDESRPLFEKDAKFFCNMLNSLFFKRAFKHGHKSFGIVCSFETGSLKKRPHIHMAISRPPSISQRQLIVLVNKAANKMKFRLGELHLIPIYSEDRWLKYIMKTNSLNDVNSLILSACFKPKY